MDDDEPTEIGEFAAGAGHKHRLKGGATGRGGIGRDRIEVVPGDAEIAQGSPFPAQEGVESLLTKCLKLGHE